MEKERKIKTSSYLDSKIYEIKMFEIALSKKS